MILHHTQILLYFFMTLSTLILIRKIIDGGLSKLLNSLGWQVTEAPPLIFSADESSSIENVIYNPVLAPYKAKNCFNVGRSCEIMKNHIISNCDDDNTFPLILG